MTAGAAHTGMVVQNNLVSLFANSGGSKAIAIDGSDAIVGNNYRYTPGRTELCRLPDGSTICEDPKLENTSDRGNSAFMRPRADSLAVDAALDVPVSDDIHGTPRPQGGAPDVGAVELSQ
jgi:hypothetical protein